MCYVHQNNIVTRNCHHHHRCPQPREKWHSDSFASDVNSWALLRFHLWLLSSFLACWHLWISRPSFYIRFIFSLSLSFALLVFKIPEQTVLLHRIRHFEEHMACIREFLGVWVLPLSGKPQNKMAENVRVWIITNGLVYKLLLYRLSCENLDPRL